MKAKRAREIENTTAAAAGGEVVEAAAS